MILHFAVTTPTSLYIKAISVMLSADDGNGLNDACRRIDLAKVDIA